MDVIHTILGVAALVLFIIIAIDFDANRKLLAVTDKELLVIFSGALANGEVKVISRKAVTSWNFEKKFFMPAVEFTAEGETYRFTNTQRGRRELFEWAMNQPL